MELVQVDRSTCARLLKPGQVKRYPDRGPLFGYFVACPACGFTALHDDEAAFEEVGGKLRAAHGPVPCLSCKRDISIRASAIT